MLLILTAGATVAQRTSQSALTVATEPGAVVFVDGIRFGTADQSGKIAIRYLSPGRHVLRVRANGYKETEKPLTTAQGEIKVALVKTTDPAELSFQEAERFASADRDKAAAAYRKAIGLRPGYVAAYVSLARVLSDSGDTDAALKVIRDMRRIAPQNAEAAAVEGRIYRDTGEDDKAIAAFKRAIVLGHGFQPEAYTGLGLLYKERAESAGSGGNFTDEAANYTEAAKNLSAALKQLGGAPDASVLYQLLGLVYERQKKY